MVPLVEPFSFYPVNTEFSILGYPSQEFHIVTRTERPVKPRRPECRSRPPFLICSSPVPYRQDVVGDEEELDGFSPDGLTGRETWKVFAAGLLS